MLADIALWNLGVIPEASVEFSPGLTVLTGETGAGKTMVVTGLRLLTGGRADASRVRTGADRAVVEGHFHVDGLSQSQADTVAAIVNNAGGSGDDGEYIVSRHVSAAGRSRAHVGGRSVPAATLKEFAEQLVTIHGQNDQLRLLSPERQREALDRCSPDIPPLSASYRKAYQHWQELRKIWQQRTSQRREIAQEVDRLRFAIGEIDAVDPQPGEDRELVDSIRRLQDVDSLREEASLAWAAIDGAEVLGGIEDEDHAASTRLGQAQTTLANSEDPVLQELATKLGAITAELSEISAELGSFLSDLPADPEQLELLLQRQQELKTLTRKYAPDCAGVVKWREKARKKLSALDISPEALDQLQRDLDQAEKKMVAAGAKLSAARRATAQRVAKDVTDELHGLAMPHSSLEIAVAETAPGPFGLDEVELRLAAASGLESRPLAAIASGGELSRVMLALEVILSQASQGMTLVFDEVDAGVGGKAAVEIGRRLARLATRHQVIVVTHLPQVAAYADVHIHVAKESASDSVRSEVEVLSEDRRVAELARMLAGLDDTATGRAHALELYRRAQQENAQMRQGSVGAPTGK
ncbi:DNA repair protein RecN [Corynebacterium poyangense]|uniref:DNA repair protein RecN n=1 Tax=Corynebacterium poyangense TaxID=2684405 RepID=A0A7H0SNP7_9CORY|nr:DNA repair protein RecN [Corynebacterium poyangense]MBZ8177718.1 DNA repair protein RecN [Corynebacterium poyangense]QNQ90172.1 DNA repair protein RecN [Corynebacterium poyangense]